MKKTLREIAEIVGGRIHGDGDVVITGISGIREARRGDITFLANSRYLPLLDETRASAVVVNEEVSPNGKPLVQVKDPDLAFARIVAHLGPRDADHPKGVSPMAMVSKTARIGRDVSIRPFCVVEDDAEIGDGTVLQPGAYVGHGTRIGNHCLIYPRVVIRERCTVGDRVTIHAGTVIGCDGFGYSTVKGVHHKIPQIGTVIIESDVEIGANVTIDRARFDKTIVRRGTKIDNLVQIAHNVDIGEHSMVVAQTGIAGSSVIGKNVILAGQSGIGGHLEVGDNAIVTGQAGVTRSVPAGQVVSGTPARPHERQRRADALMRRLPDTCETIKELKEAVRVLQSRVEELEGTTPADDD